jgi:hypothetical protein
MAKGLRREVTLGGSRLVEGTKESMGWWVGVCLGVQVGQSTLNYTVVFEPQGFTVLPRLASNS